MKYRIIAFIAALGLAAAPVTVFAENETVNNTQTAILSEEIARGAIIRDIKRKVMIPRELKEFEFRSYIDHGVTFYTCIWSNGSKELQVKYHNGMITCVNLIDPDRKPKRGFGRLTGEAAQKTAEDYLKKLYPDIKGDAVLTHSGSSDEFKYSSTTDFYISRYVNGIRFKENSGEIDFDKDTGELIYYKIDWWNDAVFPDTSKRLSEEAAADIYKSSKPLEARYELFTKISYDKGYCTSESRILPVYVPKVRGMNEIDAITGKPTEIYADKKKYSTSYAYRDIEDVVDDFSIEIKVERDPTEEEYELIHDVSAFLSYDKLDEIIKEDEFIVLDDEMETYSDNPRWVDSYMDIHGNIRPLKIIKGEYISPDKKKYSSLYVYMDAITGEIISFDKNYSPDDSRYKGISKDEKYIISRADAAAKHFLGDKADEYRRNANIEKSEDGNMKIHYNRYVNGLCAGFDEINISAAPDGEIMGFEYSYHDMDFPKPEIISEDEAYSRLFEDMKPRLDYTGFLDANYVPHVYLTYFYDDDYMLNAYTGERINEYDASPYYTAEKAKPKVLTGYTDIAGHKYEKEIQTLFEYNIRISENEKLDPDGLITIGEFVGLFDEIYDIDNFKCLYPDEWKAAKYGEDPDKDRILTRADLAKLFVSVYAKERIEEAESGKFKAPFADVRDHPGCGWIAVAKEEGFVSGSNGVFGPNAGITRAECLKAAYDYLASGDENRVLYETVKI